MGLKCLHFYLGVMLLDESLGWATVEACANKHTAIGSTRLSHRQNELSACARGEENPANCVSRGRKLSLYM